MQNDPWAAFPDATPPPVNTRPVYRQRAPEPSPQTAPQRRKDELGVEREERELPIDIKNKKMDAELKQYQIEEAREKRAERARKMREAAEARKGLLPEIVNVIDKAYEAKERSRGWLATGFGADIAKRIGGTNAADVDGLLDTIASNTAFERLQKMREASPTGGALGSVSENELTLLKSTIASLKQGQSDERFAQSMDEIANAYGRILMRLPGGKDIARQRGWIGGGKKKPQQRRGWRPPAGVIVEPLE